MFSTRRSISLVEGSRRRPSGSNQDIRAEQRTEGVDDPAPGRAGHVAIDAADAHAAPLRQQVGAEHADVVRPVENGPVVLMARFGLAKLPLLARSVSAALLAVSLSKLPIVRDQV